MQNNSLLSTRHMLHTKVYVDIQDNPMSSKRHDVTLTSNMSSVT